MAVGRFEFYLLCVTIEKIQTDHSFFLRRIPLDAAGELE